MKYKAYVFGNNSKEVIFLQPQGDDLDVVKEAVIVKYLSHMRKQIRWLKDSRPFNKQAKKEWQAPFGYGDAIFVGEFEEEA